MMTSCPYDKSDLDPLIEAARKVLNKNNVNNTEIKRMGIKRLLEVMKGWQKELDEAYAKTDFLELNIREIRKLIRGKRK